MALEAPEIFLAVPEMAPATEVGWESARELELEPVIELVKALEIAQLGQWVPSFQPLASFAVADS